MLTSKNILIESFYYEIYVNFGVRLEKWLKKLKYYLIACKISDDAQKLASLF